MTLLTLLTPFLMEIGAIPAGTGDDIRDIRPALPLPEPFAWEPWALGTLGLLIAIAAAAWWWRRSNRVRPLQLWDVALAELAEACRLMQPENAHAFSIAVSESLRTYLERRFDMPVVHRTTPEFLTALTTEGAGELSSWHDELRVFLGHCDLAKFARWRLSEEEMLALYASAKNVVEGTRPVAAGSVR